MKVTRCKDGRYVVSVQFNNKRKFFKSTDKEEVKAKAIEYINLHNKGIDFIENGILVSKLADKWFELCQKKNALSTQKRVQGIIDSYIKPYLGDYSIKNLKTHHVQKMLNEIQESHTDTTRKTFQITKAILEFAVDNDYCYKNVAKPCTINHFESKEKQILTREEIKILENSKNKYKDFFIFLLYTGLRRGEVAALKWSDIDLKKEEIHVSHSMSFLTNKGTLKGTKTGKGRIIPLTDKTRLILDSQKKKSHSIFVFSKADGSNLSESSIDRMLESILKDTGLNFRLHELRHTFCTILYYAGISTLQSSEIMGHSIKVMQEIYTHLDKDKSKLESQKLNDYLSKIW